MSKIQSDFEALVRQRKQAKCNFKIKYLVFYQKLQSRKDRELDTGKVKQIRKDADVQIKKGVKTGGRSKNYCQSNKTERRERSYEDIISRNKQLGEKEINGMGKDKKKV